MNYLIYDNECPFCTNIVKRLSKLIIKKEKISYVALTSDEGRRIVTKFSVRDSNSVIFISKNQKVYLKSRAVFNVVLLMGFPYKLLYILSIVPEFISDNIYDLIARNRSYLNKF